MNDDRVVLLLSLGLLLHGCAAKQEITHVDVFTSGQDGYHTYRIPAVETAPDGTLLVFTEARKYNRHDPGMHGNDIDLVYKRSTDAGKTWSEMMVLDDPGERWSSCNPATLVDRSTGRVWLFHNRTRPDRSSGSARVGTDDSQAWARYSQDNGRTWSDPMDITGEARDVENWGSVFIGPGGGHPGLQGPPDRTRVPDDRKDSGRGRLHPQPMDGFRHLQR